MTKEGIWRSKISAIEVKLIPFVALNKDNSPQVQCMDIFNYLILGKSFCNSQNLRLSKVQRSSSILNVDL